jgi:hypothetical protein
MFRMDKVDEAENPALSRCLDEVDESTCKRDDDDNVMENAEVLY